MNERQKQAVERFQCPGCVNGVDTACFKASPNSLACEKHVAGTVIFPSPGKIFLGMPKGFNRIGPFSALSIFIFDSVETGWGYDKFNVPVWKHLTADGFTLVRGLNPRTNYPFSHVFLTDCMAEIGCWAITDKEIKEMD